MSLTEEDWKFTNLDFLTWQPKIQYGKQNHSSIFFDAWTDVRLSHIRKHDALLFAWILDCGLSMYSRVTFLNSDHNSGNSDIAIG